MKQLIVWIVIACLLLSGCGAPQKTQAVESQSGKLLQMIWAVPLPWIVRSGLRHCWEVMDRPCVWQEEPSAQLRMMSGKNTTWGCRRMR